jgi:hypothetical protein
LAASQYDLRNALVSLAAEIGSGYITLRTLQEQLRITRENLDIQKKSLGITIKRHEAGFVSGLDVSNAQAIVASTSAQIPNLESQIRQTIYRLSLLLGEEPGALVAELSPLPSMPLPPRGLPPAMPGTLLEQRPDVRSAEESLHAATARIGVAVAALFPSLTLGANASASASQLGAWSRNVTTTYAYGPSLSWNIFSADCSGTACAPTARRGRPGPHAVPADGPDGPAGGRDGVDGVRPRSRAWPLAGSRRRQQPARPDVVDRALHRRLDRVPVGPGRRDNPCSVRKTR